MLVAMKRSQVVRAAMAVVALLLIVVWFYLSM
jgi:hypothetical protein